MEFFTLAPGKYFQGDNTAQSRHEYTGSFFDMSLYNGNISDFRHIFLSLEMLNFISFITEIFKVAQFVLNTEAF